MRLLGCLLLLASACRPAFDLDPHAEIVCRSPPDCPQNWQCQTALGLCEQRAAPDTTAPRLLSVTAVSATEVDVAFDERAIGADDPSHYTTTGIPLTILSAEMLDGQRAKLTTDRQLGGVTYTLHVSQAVTDTYGNPIDPGADTGTVVGAGPTVDQSAVVPLSPAAGERTFGGSVVLAWTAKSGAASYTVQVGATADFSDAVSHQVTDGTSLTLPTDAPVTRYWRVRADVSTADVWGQSSFEVMDDAVYAACGSTLAACRAAVQVGNRSKPMASAADALALARSIGAKSVKLATGPVPFNEPSVELVDGINLLGGYSLDFDSRDVLAPTPIVGGFNFLGRALDITSPTLVEGVWLTAPASTTDDSIALLVVDSTNALTIRSCRFDGGQSGANSVGLRLVSTANPAPTGPLVESCQATGGPGGLQGVAIDVAGASPTIHASTLNGGSGATASFALSLVQSAARVYENPLIDGGLGADGGTAIFADGSSAHVYDNAQVIGRPVGSVKLVAGPVVQSGGSTNLFERNVLLTAPAVASGESLSFTGIALQEDASTFIGGSMTLGPITVALTGPDIQAKLVSSIALQITNNTPGVGPHFSGVALAVGAHSSTGVNATALSQIVNVNQGLSVFDACTMTLGAVTSTAFVELTAFTGLGWSGQLTRSTVTVPAIATASGGAVIGVLFDGVFAASATVRDNRISIASSGNPVIIGLDGSSLGLSSATVADNTVALTGPAVTKTGMRFLQNQAPPSSTTLLVANNVVYSESTDGGNNVGIQVGTVSAATGPLVLLTNNTLLIGGASGGVGAALDLLAGANQIDTPLPPLYATNNLFVSLATGPMFGVYEEASVFMGDQATPLSLQANAFVGFGGNGYAFFDTGSQTYTYSATGPTGPSGAFADNIALSSAGAVDFVSLAAPVDLHLTPSSPTGLRLGGRDAGMSVCGPDSLQSCGQLSTDRDGTTRTCPVALVDCDSIGAYEQ